MNHRHMHKLNAQVTLNKETRPNACTRMEMDTMWIKLKLWILSHCKF